MTANDSNAKVALCARLGTAVTAIEGLSIILALVPLTLRTLEFCAHRHRHRSWCPSVIGGIGVEVEIGSGYLTDIIFIEQIEH